MLCHFRMVGVSGMGMKSPDFIAAWGCSDCHAAVDRRTNTDLDKEWLALQFLRGVIRTQNKLLEMGYRIRKAA